MSRIDDIKAKVAAGGYCLHACREGDELDVSFLLAVAEAAAEVLGHACVDRVNGDCVACVGEPGCPVAALAALLGERGDGG